MTKSGLWTLRLCVVATAFAPYPATAQQTQGACAYLPAFQALSAQLPSLSPSQAAAALSRYVASHDNPENCEYSEIDRLLTEQETKLFRFFADETRQDAQMVYRCNQFDPRTARCDSPMADNTAHPFNAGISPLAIPDSKRITFVSALPGATLAAIYKVTLADALDWGDENPQFSQTKVNVVFVLFLTSEYAVFFLLCRVSPSTSLHQSTTIFTGVATNASLTESTVSVPTNANSTVIRPPIPRPFGH